MKYGLGGKKARELVGLISTLAKTLSPVRVRMLSAGENVREVFPQSVGSQLVGQLEKPLRSIGPSEGIRKTFVGNLISGLYL